MTQTKTMSSVWTVAHSLSIDSNVCGLLGLTFSTGVLDAASYLGMDRIFTGNMTGNVLIIGFAAAGADVGNVSHGLMALVCFVVGAMICGLILRLLDHIVGPDYHRRNSYALLMAAGVLITVVSVLLLIMPAGRLHPIVATGILAAAMGMQGASVKPLNNVNITTIVVTSTLVRLGANTLSNPRKSGGVVLDQIGAVLMMGLGALCGAWALMTVNVGTAVLLSSLTFWLSVIILRNGFLRSTA